MAIAITSFNDSVRCKLHGAMIRAGAASRVTGFVGVQSFGRFTVAHSREPGRGGFQFIHAGRDITTLVLRALREK
jgi:hypothetical protein